MITVFSASRVGPLILLLLFQIVAVSCNNRTPALPAYTQEQVQQIVTPGVSRDVLISTFGQPVSETAAPEGYQVMYYVMATPVREKDFEFAGFEAFLVDGRVVKWEPIHETMRLPKK